MDIISKKLTNDRFYAYSKGRFWFWDEARNVWKESHLMTKKFALCHETDPQLAPEDFMCDPSIFESLEDYQTDILMKQALANAQPCKTVPIDPVEEIADDPAEEAVSTAVSATQDKPAANIAELFGNISAVPNFDFSALGDLSEQAVETDQQFDLHYGTAQDEYLISCIYVAKMHALTAKAGRYGGGTWTKWYESKGLSEGSARTMTQNGDAFKSATVADLKLLPSISRKDLNLIARSGCAEQLTAAAGDSQRVQELMARLKAEKARADAAEAREEEAWSLRESAEQKYNAALADVNNLAEANQRKNKELEAVKHDLRDAQDALKHQPIAGVIDEEEIDRRAAEKAWGLADARNAELQADNDQLQQDNDALKQQLADAQRQLPDLRDDHEIIFSCSTTIETIWDMAIPSFQRTHGEDCDKAGDQLLRAINRIQKEMINILAHNDGGLDDDE